MKYTAIIALALLAGCEPSRPLERTDGYDQCLRRQLFRECLKALPAGPVATQYNDWSDVVDECETAAVRQSYLKNGILIKPECRS